VTKPTLHSGKLARQPKILSVRALTRDDLACLNQPRAPQGRIKKFRNTHHRLAKLFAGGLSIRQISEISGLSYTRLHQYGGDPAFQELVAQYKPEVDAQQAEEIDEFLNLGIENMIKAERQLGEHLDRADDGDELLPVSQLLAISGDRADRFGYSKQSRQTNEVLDFARILEAQMSRMGKATVIDAEPVQTLPSGSVGPSASQQPPSPPTQPFAAAAGHRRRI
jgi:hypothetical protein